MPVYIGKSGDLVRWHQCLTDRQTTEDRATQLLYSIQLSWVTHLREPNPSWKGKRRQNLPHPLSTTPPPPFSTPPVQCGRTCGCVMRGCYCFTCVCVHISVVCVWFGPTSSHHFHNPHRAGPQEFGLRVLAYALLLLSQRLCVLVGEGAHMAQPSDNLQNPERWVCKFLSVC